MPRRIAVLIDAENIAAVHWPRISLHAATLGEPTVRRLYGDFTELRLAGWLDLARRDGLEAVMQLNGGRGKNSADIVLTIQAMDLLHSGAIDSFALVSSDRDFLPLAMRLRGAGKDVHVMCRQADDRLRGAATSTIAFNPVEADPPLVAAFKAVAHGADALPFAEVATLLRKHSPDLLPAPGSGKAIKMLLASGHFEKLGETGTIALKRR